MNIKNIMSKIGRCATALFTAFAIIVAGAAAATSLTATTSYAASADSPLAKSMTAHPTGSVWCGNYNNRSWQCVGGAYTIGYEITGVDTYSWQMINDPSQIANIVNSGQLHVGDIIRVGYDDGANGHTFIIIAIYGNNIVYADCNGNGDNRWYWGRTCTVYGNKGYFPLDNGLRSKYNIAPIMYIRRCPVTTFKNFTTGYTTAGLVDAMTFDARYYADRYPDLKAAFGYDATQLRRHYYQYGMSEGRSPSPKYDLDGYRSRYSDLKNAYGSDNAAYYRHYLNYGYKEGRNASANVSSTAASTNVVYNGSVVTISIGNSCVNLFSNAVFNGSRITAWERDYSQEQSWKLIQTGNNTYRICCMKNNRYVLDVLRRNGKISEYAAIDLWFDNDPSAQQWMITNVNGRYSIRLASNPHLALTMKGKANGNGICLARYTGSADQLFTISKA